MPRVMKMSERWSNLAVDRFLLFKVTGQSPVEISSRPTAGNLAPTENQADQDVQVGERDTRVLTPLYSSADRRVRKLGRTSKQSLDFAGGVHAGKDDPDVGAGDRALKLGYTGGGTGLARPWRGS